MSAAIPIESATERPLHRVVSGPPKRIYLQWVGDGDRSDAGNVSEDEVTWCRDKIFKADYEYRLVERKSRKAR